MHLKCIIGEAVLHTKDPGTDKKDSQTSKKHGRNGIPDIVHAESVELGLGNGKSEAQTQQIHCSFCKRAVE